MDETVVAGVFNDEGNNLVAIPAGPFDQTTVEQRADVLVYTSDPLQKAMEVTGPVRVVIGSAVRRRGDTCAGRLLPPLAGCRPGRARPTGAARCRR